MWSKSLEKQIANQWEWDQERVFIDFRTHDEEDLASWDYSRRAMFLINEDAPAPYSLDTNVWSRTLPTQLAESFGHDGSPLMLDVVNAPRKIVRAWNSREYQWSDLVNGLRAHLLEGDIMIGYSPNLVYCEAFFDGFALLGYDVSDWPGFSISGICNCGYNQNEKPEIKREFGQLLNDRHLFVDFESATAFANHCDIRVSEHAPFRVNAIYQLG